MLAEERHGVAEESIGVKEALEGASERQGADEQVEIVSNEMAGTRVKEDELDNVSDERTGGTRVEEDEVGETESNENEGVREGKGVEERLGIATGEDDIA